MWGTSPTKPYLLLILPQILHKLWGIEDYTISVVSLDRHSLTLIFPLKGESFLDRFSSIYSHWVLDAHTTNGMVNKKTITLRTSNMDMNFPFYGRTYIDHTIYWYTYTFYPGRIWSFFSSCYLIGLFLILFTLFYRKWPFPNSQAAHLSLSHLATALGFPCTFRRPVRINHCTCWNPICPSLKCHRSSSFCEGVRFWLASLVTQTAFVNALASFSLWLGRVASWVGRLFFGSYLT